MIAHAVRYAYDALDQAIEIAIDDHAPIAIERDAVGQIIRERLSPRLRREVDYSADGYLTRQRIRTDADTVVDLAYDYDAAGNLTERRDARFGIDRYVYDPVGRITQHLDPHGQIKHYLNDPAGDRLTTRIVEHEAAQAGTPDAQGEWSREGEYEGAFYRFDRAGNLIERHDRRGALHLRWDANQRLIESRLEGVSTRYRYDPLGRRIEKRTGDKVTTFVWDGDALVGDWSENPTDPVVPAKGMAREWVYYPETFEPLALLGGRSGPDTLLHYHNDPNGCPIRLTDSKGEVLWAASYTAWGQIARLHVGYVDNPIRLQGQYEDGETGLHYNRFRYYAPIFGEYISCDPIGLLGGIDLYEYAPNASNWIDPLGLKRKCEVFVRYVSEAEARAIKEANGLVPKMHKGNPSRGAKWISELGQARDPRTLGKSSNYTHKVEIEVDPGTKAWLNEASRKLDYEEIIGGESNNPLKVLVKRNEPGSYGIGSGLISDFNSKIRNIKITKI